METLESSFHSIAMKFFRAGAEWGKDHSGKEAEFSQLVKDAGEEFYKKEQEKAAEEYRKWR